MFLGPAIQKKIAAVILPQIGMKGEKKPSFKFPNWVPAIFSQNNCEQSTHRVQLLNYFINSPQVWTKRYSAEFDFLTKRIGILYGDLQGFISPIFTKTSWELSGFPFCPLVSRGYCFRLGVPPSLLMSSVLAKCPIILFKETYAFWPFCGAICPPLVLYFHIHLVGKELCLLFWDFLWLSSVGLKLALVDSDVKPFWQKSYLNFTKEISTQRGIGHSGIY